jgi:hypothetical protein
MHTHGWSLRDMEAMIPYELDLYTDLLIAAINKANQETESAGQWAF